MGSIAHTNPSSQHTQCHLPLFTLNSIPGIPSGGWTAAHILMRSMYSGIWSQLFWCSTHKSSFWTLLWEQDDCKPLHSSRDNSLGEKERVTADKHFFLCFEANHTVDIHARTHMDQIQPICELLQNAMKQLANASQKSEVTQCIRDATCFFHEY